MRHIAAIVLLVPSALTACSSSSEDEAASAVSAVEDLHDELDRLREQFGLEAVDTFKVGAENYITEPAGDIAAALSMTFTDADCDTPASLKLGSVYTCTASGDDGETYTFTVEITGNTTFEIVGIEPPPTSVD